MSDHKIKTAAGKPQLGLIPVQSLVGPSRVFGYGAKKYEPGNFHQATLSDGAGQRYVSAALRHLGAMQQSNGLHTAESLAALDEESGLPHIDHAICGLLMLRAILVKDGALVADPGEGQDPALIVPTTWDYPGRDGYRANLATEWLRQPDGENPNCTDRGEFEASQPGDCSTYESVGWHSWQDSACESCEKYYGIR